MLIDGYTHRKGKEMKLSKILILSLGMALCAGGAIGAAVAITSTPANHSGTGSFDKAIYLYWGPSETTKPASLADLDDFVVNEPQYSFLSVTPSQSASVTGSVEVTFTLAAADEDHGVNGISVAVYKTSSLLTVGTIDQLPADPVLTLTSSNLSATNAFNVGPGVAAYYAFKVVYDGTLQATGKTLGGTVTISQAYSTTILGA